MSIKPDVITQKLTIGRLLCHINWSLDGLWYNDAGSERFFYWLHAGTAHKDGKTGFMIIIFKAKMIMGLMARPTTKEQSS